MRLAERIRPKLDSARLERQWQGIDAHAAARRAPLRRRGPLALVLGTTVLGTAVAAALLLAWSPTADAPGGSFALADGSRVFPDDRADVSVEEIAPTRVAVHLAHGRARFDVTRRAERTFVVRTELADVVVLGTEFVVDASATSTAVTVLRGRVRVVPRSEPGRALELAAGERWSSAEPPSLAAAAPVAREGEDRAAPGELEVADDPAPLAAASEAARPASRRPRLEPVPPSSSPEQLLERATRARREGRIADAAREYAALSSEFPSDPRAPLASFELARLRLDHLDDARGAVEALERAQRLGPSAALREDVDARLVEALDRLGDAQRCRGAREAYLARWPRGTHSVRIARACSAE